MGREKTTVEIEGDDARTLRVWNDPDQDEFVMLQVEGGEQVTVRPRDLLDAVLFVQSLPIG
jgi:hypothetical protein